MVTQIQLQILKCRSTQKGTVTSADLRHTKAPLKAVENLLMSKRWQVTPRPLDAWHGSEKTPEQTPSCYAYGCKARPDRRTAGAL